MCVSVSVSVSVYVSVSESVSVYVSLSVSVSVLVFVCVFIWARSACIHEAKFFLTKYNFFDMTVSVSAVSIVKAA